MIPIASILFVALLMPQQALSEREIEALAGRLGSKTAVPSLVPVEPKQWELPNTNGYRPGQTTVSPMPLPQVPVVEPRPRPKTPFSFSAETEANARREIADELRDPPSAYFRDVSLRTNGTEEAICGQVSGRNGFGGMSQPMPFFVDQEASLLAKDPMLNRLIGNFCSDYPTVIRQLDWNS